MNVSLLLKYVWITISIQFTRILFFKLPCSFRCRRMATSILATVKSSKIQQMVSLNKRWIEGIGEQEEKIAVIGSYERYTLVTADEDLRQIGHALNFVKA